MKTGLRRAKLLVAFGGLLAVLGPLSPALAGTAGNYAAINGSGSTWSSVALSQWAQNLHANGIVINFNPDGSAAGRADYMQQQVRVRRVRSAIPYRRRPVRQRRR